MGLIPACDFPPLRCEASKFEIVYSIHTANQDLKSCDDPEHLGEIIKDELNKGSYVSVSKY